LRPSTCVTSHVCHLKRVYARGLLNHLPLPTLVSTGARGLLNHLPLPTLVPTGARGLLNHLPLPTLVSTGARGLLNHFPLPTLVPTGARGLLKSCMSGRLTGKPPYKEVKYFTVFNKIYFHSQE
jgi:hypothetical protein